MVIVVCVCFVCTDSLSSCMVEERTGWKEHERKNTNRMEREREEKVVASVVGERCDSFHLMSQIINVPQVLSYVCHACAGSCTPQNRVRCVSPEQSEVCLLRTE